ncbi:MAG: RsmD family RNA methyltransferase [Prevotella sp.]|nr:RsmD family RNA methyltransferase [Prevotella sp.]
MRIITGIYKGRHFEIPRSFKARPTTDFAKENIFNVLTRYINFDGAVALDLFSGTGSITLELLSRGCSRVISVEQDRDHHRFIKQCVESLSPNQGTVLPIRGDVFRFVRSCKQQFDFIFADPPYALKELPTIPDLVLGKGLLKEGGVFVFEHGKDQDFSSHRFFREHRSYGSVNFSIFTSEEQASEQDSQTDEP